MKLKEKVASVAKKVGSGLALSGAVIGTALAQTGPDTTAATAAFSETGTAVAAIGAAMVLAASAGIVYRWVTAFLIK